MTIPQFKEKILNGEITVDFGDAFCDMSKPIDYLIDKLNRIEKSFMCRRDDTIEIFSNIEDKEKSVRLLATVDDIRVLKNHTLKTSGYSDTFSLHSFITGCDHNMRLIDNTIDFVIDEYDGARLGEYNIKKELVTKLTVPSKVLVFSNHFGGELGDVPEENRYETGGKYCLSSMIGRRNLRKHLAENHNLGYGQTGNMSVYIHYNSKEIIGLDFNTEYADEMFSDETIQPLLNYLETNKFKYIGSVSCSVWRIEFVDKSIFQTLKKFNENYIEVPIKGDIINHYHYDNDVIKSEFGRRVVFKIIVEH